MRKFLAAALLTTVLAGPAYAANPFHRHHKKPDYRYHTPKYKYKAPKQHGHSAHPHNSHHE